MKELIQELTQYKQLTLGLMEALNHDEVYKIDILLNSRQMVIENIEKLQYTTEEFADICNKLNILNIQHELLELMQTKKDDTKEELKKIQLTKNANSNYNKSFYDSVAIFNKKI